MANIKNQPQTENISPDMFLKQYKPDEEHFLNDLIFYARQITLTGNDEIIPQVGEIAGKLEHLPKFKSVCNCILTGQDITDSHYKGCDIDSVKTLNLINQKLPAFIEDYEKQLEIYNQLSEILTGKPAETIGKKAENLWEIGEQVMKKIETEPETIYKTDFENLDNIVELQPGRVFVLAGRPGNGKTTFAVNCFINMIESGVKVGFITAEMTTADLLKTRIDRYKGGGYFRKLRDKCKESNPNICIDFKNNVSDIGTTIRRWKQKHGTEVVFIDHLHKLRDAFKGNDQNTAIGGAAIDIADMAIKNDVAIMLLAQMNRKSEGNNPDSEGFLKYNMADLRGSGTIEEIAYSIGFIQIIKDADPFGQSPARLSIEKNRSGQSGGKLDFNFICDNVEFKISGGRNS